MICFSALLSKRFPELCNAVRQALSENHVSSKILPKTQDIWLRDFMPIKAGGSYVQFVYEPDYLKSGKWQKTISNSHKICEALGISVSTSLIKVDGGNVLLASSRVILCDKVLRENPTFTKARLRADLENIFQSANIILIPSDPLDPLGHADGILRFIDSDTVLLSDYSVDPDYNQLLKSCLRKNGIKWEILPSDFSKNTSIWDAAGCYINFLDAAKLILVPTFNRKKDEQALRKIEDAFPGKAIIPIDCRKLAPEGGLLNCISWEFEFGFTTSPPFSPGRSAPAPPAA